jgi:DNA helicase II / ATP-dependent DNA helicase PcrA
MSETSPEFDSAYKKLNDAQRLAVDTIEGPVLVLAGPGTGKTQVLTTRIANILKQTDTTPESILALTYTDAATREMKDRLIKLIGKDGYFVKVTSYHSFCSDIISENPERFSRPKGLSIATDLEKIQLIKEILEGDSFPLLKPAGDPTYYLKYILGAIADLKREGYPIEKYKQLVNLLQEEFELEKGDLKKGAFKERETLVGKNKDLLKIYEKYQAKLSAIGRYDFEDMINWVVDAFEKDSDFLLTYQEKFQYILGDEYQDTNNSQNRLIFALASFWGEDANVFVVGDPNQSIFRFQGASKENVREFQKRFPNLKKIVLDQNYRSTQTLLEASAGLISETPLHHTVKFPDVPIKVAKFSSPLFEDEFIVDTIKRKIKAGAKARDFAVITKDNADIENLVNLFKSKGLPYRLEGGVNILSTPLISQFLKIISLVTSLQNKVDDLDLFLTLNFPYFKLNPLSVLKISRYAHEKRESLMDTLLDAHPDIDPAVIDVFHRFLGWNSKATIHTVPEMFQMIFQESGLLDYILALPQPIQELNRFGTLFEDVKKQSAAFPGLDLFGYVFNLKTMDENGIKLEEMMLIGDENAVTLTTVYKAKGLEWKTVFIYRFADTHWGNHTKRQMIKLPPGIISLEDTDKEDKNAEERRVFYVAMTRAKKDLYLTGATEYPSALKMVFPSLFLEEIPKNTRRLIKVGKYQKNAEKILGKLMSVTTTPVLHDGEKEYLKEIIKDIKLSPTSLNKYLECHYKFKLDNLYRIPRTTPASAGFGTAVHSALQNLYLDLENTKKLPSKESFIKDFEAALLREVLSDSDFKNYLEKGRKVLNAYYEYYKKDFVPALFTEKKFGSSLTSQIVLDDIPLSGKADRIDLTSKADKHVRFVDYKTGQPKSRNDIEGLNKNSSGDYKRQLVFYQLLADLDHSFDYKVTETQLQFIEADKSGNFHQERFNITPAEVNDLKKIIKESMASIRSLKFDRTTNYTHCVRCDFRSHCWPNGLPVTQSEEE